MAARIPGRSLPAIPFAWQLGRRCGGSFLRRSEAMRGVASSIGVSMASASLAGSALKERERHGQNALRIRHP